MEHVITIIIAFIVYLIGYSIFGDSYFAGWIFSIIAIIALLAII